MNNFFTKKTFRFLTAATSGLLLAIPYNFPFFYLLTWVAFVPILLTIHSNTFSNDISSSNTIKSAYFSGLIFGLVFYGVGASWIIEFIQLFKGYETSTSIIISIFFWLYCSQLTALLFSLYQWALNKKIASPLILFPCLILAFYGFFPMLFSVQLGESQSKFLIALQGIEYTGAYGLDFIIGLTNIVIALSLLALIKKKNVRSQYNGQSLFNKSAISLPIASSVVIAWFLFGTVSLNSWKNKIDTWPTTTIGLVQPNETPHEKIPLAPNGYSYSYPPEIALSEAIINWSTDQNTQVDFIVWPETRYKGYFRYPLIKHAFTKNIRELNTPVIFQDIERGQDRITESSKNEINRLEKNTQRNKTYSSVLHIDKNGELVEAYRKIKRVPFGEYVPFINNSETVKKWFNRYFGGFFSDFSAGEDHEFFTLNNLPPNFTKNIHLIPLICYEIMFPDFVANAVAKAPSNKPKILLALSNNGWFGETLQPYQHLHSSVLRSVENRISLVHAVNNGPSGVITPTGQLAFQSNYHQQEAYIVKAPISLENNKKGEVSHTFFNRHPYFFIQLVFFLLLINILARPALNKIKKSI